MKKAFIFRGPPASGKSTLSTNIINLLEGKVAYLELDMFRWGIHTLNKDSSKITDDEHKFAYYNFLKTFESYCRNGNYTLVVEGLFSWEQKGVHGYLKDKIKFFKNYEFEYKLFYLSANDSIFWKRNKKRDHIVPKGEFDILYRYVGLCDDDSEIKINVADSLEKSVAQVKKYL